MIMSVYPSKIGWVALVGGIGSGWRVNGVCVTSQKRISGARCLESRGTADAIGLVVPTSESLAWNISQIESPQQSSVCSTNTRFSRWRGGQQPRGDWSW